MSAAVTELSSSECVKCGFDYPDGSKFCSECGAPISIESPQPATPQTTKAAVKEFVTGTAREISSTGKEALRSDIGKKMAAGAALGAVAAAAIPLIGWATGAALGAGVVAYRRLLK